MGHCVCTVKELTKTEESIKNSKNTSVTFIDTKLLSWIKEPINGRFHKTIGKCTTLVKINPNTTWDEHIHPNGEEFFILNGKWTDKYGNFTKYNYIRNYIGSKHEPIIGNQGCIIMAIMGQMSIDIIEPEHTSWNASPNNDKWIQYKNNIKRLNLYKSVSENVFVEIWGKNCKINIEIPINGKEILVVDGEFRTNNGIHNELSWTTFQNKSNKSYYIDGISGDNGCYIWCKEGHLNVISK